jgi:hypothetical protein
MASIGDWLASMNPAQTWIVTVLLLLLLGRLVQATTSSQGRLEALFNVGAPAVAAAAAGGLRLLLEHADALKGAVTGPNATTVANGKHLDAAALQSLGEQLFVDTIYVYIVFALVVATIFLELEWAAKARRAKEFEVTALAKRIGVGYLAPAFVGGFALYLMYTAA